MEDYLVAIVIGLNSCQVTLSVSLSAHFIAHAWFLGARRQLPNPVRCLRPANTDPAVGRAPRGDISRATRTRAPGRSARGAAAATGAAGTMEGTATAGRSLVAATRAVQCQIAEDMLVTE